MMLADFSKTLSVTMLGRYKIMNIISRSMGEPPPKFAINSPIFTYSNSVLQEILLSLTLGV